MLILITLTIVRAFWRRALLRIMFPILYYFNAFTFELPHSLYWELQDFENDLAESRTNLQNMIADSDLLSITPSYGKGVPKKCKLSPDGWFQVNFELSESTIRNCVKKWKISWHLCAISF